MVLILGALLLSNLSKPVEDIGIRNGLSTKTLRTVHKKLVLVGYQVDDNFVVFAIRAYELFIHSVLKVASGSFLVVEGQLAVALPFAGVAVDVFKGGGVWEESFVLFFAAGEFGLHASVDADPEGIFLGKGSGEAEHFFYFFLLTTCFFLFARPSASELAYFFKIDRQKKVEEMVNFLSGHS